MNTDIPALVAFVLAATSSEELCARYSKIMAERESAVAIAVHRAVFPQLRAALIEVSASKPPLVAKTLTPPEGCDEASIGDLVRSSSDPARTGFIYSYATLREESGGLYMVEWFDGSTRGCRPRDVAVIG